MTVQKIAETIQDHDRKVTALLNLPTAPRMLLKAIVALQDLRKAEYDQAHIGGVYDTAHRAMASAELELIEAFQSYVPNARNSADIA